MAFEACATAHHWARLASIYGHQVKIIPAISVAPFRQGHKTDKNDALAVAEAAKLPDGTTAYTLRHSVISDLVHDGLDLLTVAQAIHWFDHPRFCAEAARVRLRSQGAGA